LRVQRDSVDGNDTVSEGISYGMSFRVCGDQATFNGLWQYKQIHNDGLGLMNWKISSGGGTIGSNSRLMRTRTSPFALPGPLPMGQRRPPLITRPWPTRR